MTQASPPGATAVAPPPGASTTAAGPPAAVGAPAGTPAAGSRIRDTPQRLRLLTVEVIVAGLDRRPGRRTDLRLPGLLLEPGRGRCRAVDQSAEDPDQSAVGRCHRDERLPGRRPRAAGPARGVRPGDAGREHPDRRSGPGAAGGHRGVVGAQPATGQLRGLDRAGPGQQPAGSARSAPSTCGSPAPSSGAPRFRSWTTSSRPTPIAPADEMDVRIGYLAVAIALLGLAAVILIQVWVARRFRRRINVGLLLSSVVLLLTVVIGLVGVVAAEQHGEVDQGPAASPP